MAKTLRLILGDQLNVRHSWFQEVDDAVTFLMIEMRQETDYVPHHIQKVVGFFFAMRNFAEELKVVGHQIKYFTLDDPENRQNLSDQLDFLISTHGFDRFEYQNDLSTGGRPERREILVCPSGSDFDCPSRRVYPANHRLERIHAGGILGPNAGV